MLSIAWHTESSKDAAPASIFSLVEWSMGRVNEQVDKQECKCGSKQIKSIALIAS